MIEITKSDFKEKVEDAHGLTVIDLYADWCAPCRMLAPILSEIESEMPEVRFCKINVDKEGELAALFRVESIPMVALVKDNTFLDFSIGLTDKETLVNLINEYK